MDARALTNEAEQPRDPLHEEIDSVLPHTRQRTFKLPFQGEILWIKKPRRGPGFTMYGLQAAAAAATRVPILWPPRVSRGPEGLHREAERLRHLARKGWPVPQVVALSERWLALRDNGRSIAPTLRTLSAEGRLDLLRRLLEFLQALHADGGWHGASQPRNFTQIGNRFGLVDFEDDLEPSMPLPVRQARDIAIFAMSAARFSDRDGRLMEALLADAHRRASPDVDAVLTALARRLARLHRLAQAVPAWAGPDPRAVAVLAGAYRRFLGLDGEVRSVTAP
jgi:hypothetical protein